MAARCRASSVRTGARGTVRGQWRETPAGPSPASPPGRAAAAPLRRASGRRRACIRHQTSYSSNRLAISMSAHRAAGGRGPSPRAGRGPPSCPDRSSVLPRLRARPGLLRKASRPPRRRQLARRPRRGRYHPGAPPRPASRRPPRGLRPSSGGPSCATTRSRSVISTVSPAPANRTYSLSLFFSTLCRRRACRQVARVATLASEERGKRTPAPRPGVRRCHRSEGCCTVPSEGPAHRSSGRGTLPWLGRAAATDARRARA